MAGGGATLREPYRGPSQLAVPFPGTSDKPKPEPVDDGDADDGDADDGGGEDQGDVDDGSGSASTPRKRGGGRGRRLLAAPRANDVSGALFAVIAWSWIVLPLVQGGPSRVRDVWRAKWINKDSEGKWLG